MDKNRADTRWTAIKRQLKIRKELTMLSKEESKEKTPRLVRYLIEIAYGDECWFRLPVDSSFLDIVSIGASDYLIVLVGKSDDLHDCCLLYFEFSTIYVPSGNGGVQNVPWNPLKISEDCRQLAIDLDFEPDVIVPKKSLWLSDGNDAKRNIVEYAAAVALFCPPQKR